MKRATRRQALIFRAIADPTRRAILDLLREGRQPVGGIAGRFPVSRPAISKHLRLLRQAALVREHREGRNRIYQLNPAPLVDVYGWLEPYREFWQRRLERLKTYVESKPEGVSKRAAGETSKKKRQGKKRRRS